MGSARSHAKRTQPMHSKPTDWQCGANGGNVGLLAFMLPARIRDCKCQACTLSCKTSPVHASSFVNQVVAAIRGSSLQELLVPGGKTANGRSAKVAPGGGG